MGYLTGYDAIRPHGPYHDYAMDDVHRERIAQCYKWGKQTHDDLRWLGILMEEVGELSKEIIEGKPDKVRQSELVQVAAVAVAWLEWMTERQRIQ